MPIHRTTEEYDNGGIFIILYGQGGSGKTALAASLADQSEFLPYLHIDIEGGIDTVRGKPGIDFVEIFNWSQFDRLTAELVRSRGGGYKTICVDNLSEAYNQSLTAVSGSPTDAVEIQEYGTTTRQILHKIRQYRDLARNHGLTIIVCIWDANEKDAKGTLKLQFSLPPKLREQVPGIVTIVGHIDVLSNPDLRKIDFAPNPKTVSKWRRPEQSNARKVPYQIYYGLSNMPLADVISTSKGGDWPAKKYPVPTGARVATPTNKPENKVVEEGNETDASD